MLFETLHYLTRADASRKGSDPATWLKTTAHDGSAALGRAMIAEAEKTLDTPASAIYPRTAGDDDFAYGAALLVKVEAETGIAYTWGCFAEE